MISTTNLLTFYWWYAQWALRGKKVAWAYKNGIYYITTKAVVERWINQ